MESASSIMKGYVERMKEIRILSTPNLKDIQTADEYSLTLTSNFKRIGELATENRKVIDTYIKPLLEENHILSEKEIKNINLFGELLVDDATFEEVDVHLSEILNDLLLQDELRMEEKGDENAQVIAMARKVKRDYYRVSGLTRYNNDEITGVRKDALENHKALMEYLEKDKFVTLNEEAKQTLLQFCLLGTLLYEETIQARDASYWEPCIAVLKRGEEVLKDSYYHELLPEYDWAVFEFRIYYYGSFLAYSVLPEEIAKAVCVYAKKAIEFIQNTENELIRETVNEEQERDLLYMARVWAKEVSARETCDFFYDSYSKRDSNDYSVTGNNTNLDTPSSYLMVAKMLHLELVEKDYDRYYEIEKSMLDYLYHIPKTGDTYLKCVTLFSNLPQYYREVPNALSMRDFCPAAFAAIHPPTYVHVNMVARFTECIVRHMLRTMPQVFIGFPGCENVEDVEQSRGRIIRYAYKAALCHDLGKLFIIDIIGMYGRALLDSEFAIIKNHPSIGAKVAQEHESTRNYVDVIKGHHIWYDGSRGYPENFDTSKSPYKSIIDVVLVADCLDAATDTVGRSYSRGKTFDEFYKEIEEGAGTHYAPFFIELFQQEECRQDIEYLLREGRQKLYKETFRLLRSNEAQ